MNKESLIKAREIILGALIETNEINLIDKLELAINLSMLLDSQNYESDIQLLRENQKKKSKRFDFKSKEWYN